MQLAWLAHAPNAFPRQCQLQPQVYWQPDFTGRTVGFMLQVERILALNALLSHIAFTLVKAFER